MDYKDLYYNKVIDNREIDMVEVLQHFLDDEDVRCLNVAVGYFYISGLELIKDSFIRLWMSEMVSLISLWVMRLIVELPMR